MKQSVSLVTLGVGDHERAKAFYQAIGWIPALDVDDTAFYRANGVVLALWGREKLAADMGIDDEWGSTTTARAGAGSRWRTTSTPERRSTL